jgi:hypothetical protein
VARQVYFENWQAQLEKTIDAVSFAAGTHSEGSFERDALTAELEPLRELSRQVRDVAPGARQPVSSILLPWSVREQLQLPDDLVSRVGELFDIYRRFHDRLTWSS